MNAVTKPIEPMTQLRAQMTALGPEIKNALPSHIKVEKFQRVVATVVQQQPDLLAADRRSLLGACMKCAADGLIPDGREAALVIFNTKTKIKFNRADGSEGEKDQWIKKVQYMPMMAGILKRIRNAGEIASVQAHMIYEKDHFVIKRGLDDTIEHIPLFPGDRGSPIGAYAVAKFKDGSDPQFEVMDITDIEKVRAVSKTGLFGPWKDWFDEMARKTVFRRLSKWLPMDAEIEGLLTRDEAPNVEPPASVTIDGIVDEPQSQIAAPSKLDILEGEFENATDAELVGNA